MKIICIGRNYADHVRELRDGGTIPAEPLFFLKPDTALLRNNDPSLVLARRIRLICAAASSGIRWSKRWWHQIFLCKAFVPSFPSPFTSFALFAVIFSLFSFYSTDIFFFNHFLHSSFFIFLIYFGCIIYLFSKTVNIIENYFYTIWCFLICVLWQIFFRLGDIIWFLPIFMIYLID